MAYIFLDESGDLGFDFSKHRTTKFFVVTALATENERPIDKVVRKVHAGLRKKYRLRANSLHAAHEESATCARFCRLLAEKDCRVMAIDLNKQKVYTRLQDEKQVLYNYVTNILLDRIMTKRLVAKRAPIHLIASRRETNKFLNQNFRQYLEEQIKNNHKLTLDIKIMTPFEKKGLQAVDMASWAIFRKYEYGDESYYNLLRNIIVEESPLFP